jgi:Protein of unknown function with PCYCGC motif
MKQKENNNMKMIVSIAIIVMLTGVAALFFLPPGAAKSPDPTGLPAFALGTDRIKEAYEYARDNATELNGEPCYCGCMQMAHNGRLHKRGLLDCFIKEDGSYEVHGSTCEMCVNDTLLVKSLVAQGKTHDEIKAVIDKEHAPKT